MELIFDKPDNLSPWERFVPNFTLYSGSERFYQNPGLASLLYWIAHEIP